MVTSTAQTVPPGSAGSGSRGTTTGQPGGARHARGPRTGWAVRLVQYCRRYPVVSLIAAAGSCSIAFTSLVPLLTKVVIDDIEGGRGDKTYLALLGLVGVGVVVFGTTFVRRYTAGRLSLQVQHDLRQDAFAAIQRLDGPGQDRLRTGQVVSRANTDLQMVQRLMSMVPMAVGQLMMIVVSLVLMLTLSPLLTVTAVVVIPAAVYLARTSRTTIFPATWMAQQNAAEVAEIVEEDVTGVRVVKGFGQEEREVGRLRAMARVLYANRLRAARFTAKLNPAMSALTSVGQVLVLALGGWLAIQGHISLGTLVAFTLYLAALVGPARMITMLFIMGQQAGAAAERVLEIIDLDAEIVDPPHPVPLPAGPLAVDLDGVRFGYSTDEAVLDDFTLHVPAGRTVAVVGPSGSGKSTLSLLLPRFYDTAGGIITVGGTDIRDVTLAELRDAVGVVFEEAFLFSDTIAANIGYGRPGASPREIRAAATAAEADEFIQRLPHGYDTVIGERGLTLSGGQRQRLALARAMITDPRVLILDDATSAVDPATEAAIHDTLHRLTADRTTILIAHRRSTLGLADTIAVVDRGRIVDHGPHAQLIERCPLYASLLGTQLAETHTGAELHPGPDGVTPQLWPQVKDDGPTERTVAAPSRGGGGRGMGGMMAATPATPELLARIDALPPATDEPVEGAGGEGNEPDGTGRERFSLWKSVRPLRRLFTVALVLVGLDAAAVAAVPALLRTGVDFGVTRHSLTIVLGLAGAAAFVVLADYVVQRIQMVVMARAGESVLYGLRIREFAHLQRLGLDYYERELAGRIMTRMTSDVDALSSFLQTGLITAVVALATFIAVAIALAVMNPALALVAFAVIPFLIVATVFFRRYASAQYTLAREQVAIVNADLQENVAGLRVAQALGRQDANSATFAEKSDRYRRIRLRAQTAISLYFPFVTLLGNLAAVGVLAVGSHRVGAGTLTVGTLLAFVLYLDNLFTPIQQLSQVFDGYQQANVSLHRISELLDTPTSTPAPADPITVERLEGRVALDDVGFGYSDDAPPALIDVDLAFRPGETVAVVGATGAGKSTLVKLIARFYDVTSGRVLVDDMDVRRLDLPAYRRRLGVVPQEAHLFVGTVRDNIAYGRPEADDAQVEAAARAVGALDAVAALPHGFRHRIDERGRNLSAGQRQLVSLARAELVRPDVLLLDEATAALDPAAEMAVLDATDRLASGRTTVVVAHRLTTASRADRIVVMDHGRVVEIGTHDELLARGGTYTHLYRRRDETG